MLRSVKRTPGLWLGLLLWCLPLGAQPPAETCGVGDSLGGTDMLPFLGSLNVTGDDFTMTGTGCTEQGEDHVTCLTPANSCTVNATCRDGFSKPETSGLQVAVNAFQGSCSTSPASCLDSDGGTGSGTISGLALTAGVTYCFVCEAGTGLDLELEINAVASSCGALPVELETYSVD